MKPCLRWCNVKALAVAGKSPVDLEDIGFEAVVIVFIGDLKALIETSVGRAAGES